MKYNYNIIIIDSIITWGTLITLFSVGAGWYAFLIIPFGLLSTRLYFHQLLRPATVDK